MPNSALRKLESPNGKSVGFCDTTVEFAEHEFFPFTFAQAGELQKPCPETVDDCYSVNIPVSTEIILSFLMSCISVLCNEREWNCRSCVDNFEKFMTGNKPKSPEYTGNKFAFMLEFSLKTVLENLEHYEVIPPSLHEVRPMIGLIQGLEGHLFNELYLLLLKFSKGETSLYEEVQKIKIIKIIKSKENSQDIEKISEVFRKYVARKRFNRAFHELKLQTIRQQRFQVAVVLVVVFFHLSSLCC